MASRVVVHSTKILPISRGDTLTVKRRLNPGEAQDAQGRMAIVTGDGNVRLNLQTFQIATTCAYLVDWTLVDPQGDLIDIKGKTPEEIESALRSLDEDSVKEIREAVEAHVEAEAK